MNLKGGRFRRRTELSKLLIENSQLKFDSRNLANVWETHSQVGANNLASVSHVTTGYVHFSDTFQCLLKIIQERFLHRSCKIGIVIKVSLRLLHLEIVVLHSDVAEQPSSARIRFMKCLAGPKSSNTTSDRNRATLKYN